MGDTDVWEVSTSHSSSSTPDKCQNSVVLEECGKQPAPPGTVETEEFPFLEAVKACEEPLIGLEFVVEQKLDDQEESHYMCLLCNKDVYCIRSIFQHLTNQEHYLTYLEQYFPHIFSSLKSLNENQVNENGFKTLVSHLIGKLEEKHGLSRPIILRDSVLQIDSLKEIMLNNNHLRETENESLNEMLKAEFIDDVNLLKKNFPLKPRRRYEETVEESPVVLIRCDSKNEIIESSENQNVVSRSDDTNITDISTESMITSSSDKCEITDELPQIVEVGSKDSSFSSTPQFIVSTKKEKTMPFDEKVAENTESQLPKPVLDFDSDLPVLSGRAPRKIEPCLESEKSSSSRLSTKRRNRRKSSTPPSAGQRFSRSRSPVRFPVLSISSEKRNYRKRSPSSSSSYSPRRRRSRSVSRRRRLSSSSYSSNSASSPRRVKHGSSIADSSSKKRHRRDSYEYREVAKEAKVRGRSKNHRNNERSHSPSPNNRRSPKRSYSTSPARRLRRILAHETLSKNTGCLVRFDAAKSFSSPPDGNNTEGGQRKIARVTSEVRVEVKSTVNSEKLTDQDKMNKFQQKIRLIKKRLRHERREYKKRPESYPSFAEEWKIFWCNRFKEIQAAGKEDPHNYDYRKDWMRYWLVRVKQIYKERYKRLKAELMENLGVSKEKKNKNVTSSEEVVIVSDGQESASPRAEEIMDESIEAEIDSRKNCDNAFKENECTQISKGENSAANTFSSVTMQQQLNLLTQTISACMSSACSQTLTPSVESPSNLKDSQVVDSIAMKNDDSVDIDLEDDLSLISVLRQLSVLETQLGSTATLITNLLANGLAREKKLAGSSIRLLTYENRLFLDVIKEKLKGQLILEVVPSTMVKATKKCIKSIDELMKAIPEPKLPDPKLAKIPEQNVSSKSFASLPITTHVPSNSGNNTSSANHSMSRGFPTAIVYSVSSHNPSANVHPVSVLSTPVRPSVSELQYLPTSETYPSPRRLMNSVNSTNQLHPTIGTTASASSTMPRQSTSNRPEPNQNILAEGITVQSALTGSSLCSPSTVPPSSITTYSSKNQSNVPKRLSVYDKIPWSEQLAATIPVAGPPARPSTNSSSLHSSTSANRPQIPHVSSSTRSQIPSLVSAASHSRLPSNALTSSNFLPDRQTSDDSGAIPMNLPSQNSGSYLATSTSSNFNASPVTSTICNSVVSTQNSRLINTRTSAAAGSQIISIASSAATAAASSSTTKPSCVIDLTDDSPDGDENNEPINKLSETKIIQLLINFRQLPRYRQQELVTFLRKLEKTHPAVVENFKKYVQFPPSK